MAGCIKIPVGKATGWLKDKDKGYLGKAESNLFHASQQLRASVSSMSLHESHLFSLSP
jgi:hypothetical protein